MFCSQVGVTLKKKQTRLYPMQSSRKRIVDACEMQCNIFTFVTKKRLHNLFGMTIYNSLARCHNHIGEQYFRMEIALIIQIHWTLVHTFFDPNHGYNFFPPNKKSFPLQCAHRTFVGQLPFDLFNRHTSVTHQKLVCFIFLNFFLIYWSTTTHAFARALYFIL